LILDFYEGTHPAPADMERSYLEYIAWNIACIRVSDPFVSGALLQAFTAILKADAEDPSSTSSHTADEFLQMIVHTIETSSLDPSDTLNFSRLLTEQLETVMHRQYVFTEGSRFAIGPESAEPGDEIWILAGSNVPIVLRKASSGNASRYSFVGQAYVHGIMFGEAITHATADGLRSITLV
jgi:hypothetical protein